MKIRHVILDRDGVLNCEAPDSGYIREPGQFCWLPGAIDGLRMLRQAGIRISVATNQSGVGRGLMTLKQLGAVHEHMCIEAARNDAALDAVFFCPHAPEARCECRKPAPGLIRAAVALAGIDSEETLVVGDDRRDLQAAWRAGVAAVLLRTGKGHRFEHQVRELGVPVYNDLLALARAILAGDIDTAEQAVLTVHKVFTEHMQVVAQAADNLPPVLEQIIEAVSHCLTQGHKILACGNGGSATDALHFVAELVGRFREERRALPAIALTADTATLTAVANDYGYERVFARQVEALAQPGDILFALSTSGNSANVVQAAETARRLGCTVIALTGAQGGLLANHADLLVRAPSNVVARIQEVHALCIHMIAEAVDTVMRKAVTP